MDESTLSRIFERVKKTPRGCWISSRPQVLVNGRQMTVRRLLYEDAVGPLPSVLYAACGQDGCVNPGHVHGPGDLDEQGRMNLTLLCRFMSRVERQTEVTSRHVDTPCWLWTGGKCSSGYGNLMAGSAGPQATHRLSFRHFVGPIPDGGPTEHGWCVLHRCDTPACVNPEHLRLGSQLANVQDCTRKRRKPHGTAHFRAKLTPAKVRELRRRHAAGETFKSIADDLGVNLYTVRSAALRLTWKHVE